MKIESVSSPSFAPYGKVVTGIDTTALSRAVAAYPFPATGTFYAPSVSAFEVLPVYGELQNRFYGGMPIEIGVCNGRNKLLNCLEYHRDSEVDVAAYDMVLLLAKEEQIVNGSFDTANVRAFLVPAGTAVELYATTLHYAPCHTVEETGFAMAVVLPRGTNTDRPDSPIVSDEDKLLRARNKWLIAHAEAPEAAEGAYVGMTGENIRID